MTVVSDYTAILSDSISAAPGKAAFYTYSFDSAPPSYLSGQYSAGQLATFQPLSEAQKSIARQAIGLWAAASGVTFFEVTSGPGDINFGIYDMAALGESGFAGFAYLGTTDRYGIDSDVFLSASGASSLHVVLHEVGHALGLKHPFEGSVTLASSLDNWSHTVMSYTADSTGGVTLGSFDVQAIQYLYGAASNDGTEVPSWSWNTTTQTLTQTGGDLAETIIGTAARDIIQGGGGDDSIIGGSGGDSLDGGDGNDTISAVVSADYGTVTVLGGAGDDSLWVDLASATPSLVVDGGTGTDSLFLSNADFAAPLDINLGNANFQISNVERVYVLGGSANDHITGSSGAEQLQGGAGNDSIVALAGDDTIFGQDGADTLIGGMGADYIAGGNGADRFVYGSAAESPVSGPDTIGDFASGTDILDVTAFPLWDLSVTGSGTSYTVTGSGLASDFKITVTGTITMSDILHQTVGVHVAGSSSGDSLSGGAGRDFLEGLGGNDTLLGLGGDDWLSGGPGNDSIDGGAGVDIALFADVHGAATVTHDALNHTLVVATPTDGTDRLTRVEQVQFADGLYSYVFTQAGAPVVANFNPAFGWASQDQYPRHVADVNGDGYADIVGFGTAGVLVSFGSAGGTFTGAAVKLADFGQASGWATDNGFHRELADVNGDGRADILGFGYAGTLVSLARADGTFGAVTTGIANFGVNQGWANQNGFARTTGDVNGDGKADLVGFGYAGALVALGNGDGTFKPVATAVADFGVDQGWANDNSFHRALADVNGDGRADIVGFGYAGTLVALGKADGTFGPAQLVLADFGVNQGWTSNDSSSRLVADVNHDGKADIVGFGTAGTMIAFGKGDGTFTQASLDVGDFGRNQGWTSDNTFHREIADVNHDGLADIVGFGIAGVLVGANQGDFLI